jgi:hypothetical protein
MAFDTAGNIVNAAAGDLGLGKSADPFQNADANWQRICGLLSSIGQEVRKRRKWTHLRKQQLFTTLNNKQTTFYPPSAPYVFTIQDMAGSGKPILGPKLTLTVSGLTATAGLQVKYSLDGGYTAAGYAYNGTISAAGAYQIDLTGITFPAGCTLIFSVSGLPGDSVTYTLTQSTYFLPPDFKTMVPQSGWDRTNRLPLGGPLTEQEWQYLAGRLVGVVFTVLFRPMQQQMYFYPETACPGGHQIAFEYETNYWVAPAGSLLPGSDTVVSSSDVVLFDKLLMRKALIWAFKDAVGFDTTSALAQYEGALGREEGDDTNPKVLSLNKKGVVGDRLIGDRNVPLTGFGGV